MKMRAMEGFKSSFGIVGIILCGIIYSYYVVSKIARGLPRIIAVLPVIGMYIILPWQVSTLHMRGAMSFMFMWISSFKLLMLSFNVGPLAKPWTMLNLRNFMAVSIFPIEIRESVSKPNAAGKFRTLRNVALEACLLSVVIYSYSFRNSFSPSFIVLLYCVHIYLALDIALVFLAALANVCLGVQLEPQFNKPYLSRSLQDFWGKRWNLIVTRIFRPSVYDPVLYLCCYIHIKLCKKIYEKNQPKEVGGKSPLWARAVAVLSVFVVSGLMHELIFYYATETKASWEVTAFFILHGLCLTIEVGLRRKVSPYVKVPNFIAIPVTLTFIYITALWLFFPPVTRFGTDLKAIAEYGTVLQLLFSTNHEC